MTKPNSVSIIIPVYQVSAYIERCIQSVMNQTYRDIECIIVDDCGTDDSMSKCNRLIQTYIGPIDFIILHHEHNRGQSAARNTGIRQAQGEWLFFLDSDDELTSNCIEALVTVAIENKETEMVQGLALEDRPMEVKPGIWEHSHNLMHSCIKLQEAPSIMTSNEEIRTWFYKEKAISLVIWNKLFKRSFILHNNLFFKESVIFEETPYSIYLYKYLNHVGIVKEITYIYHIRSGSTVTGSSLMNKAQSFGENMIDVLSNLTPSWECAEMDFFLNRFISRCAFLIHKDSMSKKAFSLYWKQARKYHCRSILINLAMAYISSYFTNSEFIFKKLKMLKRRLCALRGWQ